MSLLQKTLLPVSPYNVGLVTTLMACGAPGPAGDARANVAMTIWIAPPHVDRFAYFCVGMAERWRGIFSCWFLKECLDIPAFFALRRFVGGEQKKGGGQSRPAPAQPGQTKPQTEREKEQERVKKGKTRGQLVQAGAHAGELEKAPGY